MPNSQTIISRRFRSVNGGYRSRFVLGICLLSFCAFGCSEESRAKKIMAEAKKQIATGELDAAVALLQKIDSDYPETQVADRAREQVRFYRSLANAEAMFPLRQTRDTMISTARAIQLYRDRHRRWPASLETIIPKWIDQTPVDTWGRTLIYKRKASGRGYVLASLGADWKPGGSEDSSDLIVEDGNFVTRSSLTLP